jgi:hypothetical protein
MAKTAQDYLAELKAEEAAKTSTAQKAAGVDSTTLDAAKSKAYQANWLANFWKPRETGYRNAASSLGDQFYNQFNDPAIAARNNVASIVQAQNAAGSGSGGTSGMSDAELKAEANKREAYDIARGNVSRVTEDPIDKLIREQLQGVATGKNVPFNDEVRNAMFSEQADMGGAANAVRAEKILAQATDRGLNPNDPGVQAALRNSLTQQQLGAQGARQDIAKTANRENFAAQQQGLNQLTGVNNAYQGRITGANANLQNMLWNERFNQQTQMPGMASTPTMLPSYSQYNQRQRQRGGVDSATYSGGIAPSNGSQLYGGTAGPQQWYPTADDAGNINTLGGNDGRVYRLGSAR